MKTASGMIIRRNHITEWDDILWPVAQRFHEKGWRTGSTRVYTLKCGHYYSAPASSAEGRGKTANCINCCQLWRWITTENCGGVSVDHAIQRLQPGVLAHMEDTARAQGCLVRPVGKRAKEELHGQ